VGFGVDSRAKARDTARRADGVVVGTALVRAIEGGKTAREREDAAAELVRQLRMGADEA
jgi:tryptophan synthase alpha chain